MLKIVSTAVIEKSVLFNIVESMHDNVNNYVYADVHFIYNM